MDNFLRMSTTAMSQPLEAYLESVVNDFFPREDLPSYVDADKFFHHHQKEVLREIITTAKADNPKNKTVIFLNAFLLPLISDKIDPGASAIMNYLIDDGNFAINVPENIWNLL